MIPNLKSVFNWQTIGSYRDIKKRDTFTFFIFRLGWYKKDTILVSKINKKLQYLGVTARIQRA